MTEPQPHPIRHPMVLILLALIVLTSLVLVAAVAFVESDRTDPCTQDFPT